MAIIDISKIKSWEDLPDKLPTRAELKQHLLENPVEKDPDWEEKLRARMKVSNKILDESL